MKWCGVCGLSLVLFAPRSASGGDGARPTSRTGRSSWCSGRRRPTRSRPKPRRASRESSRPRGFVWPSSPSKRGTCGARSKRQGSTSTPSPRLPSSCSRRRRAGERSRKFWVSDRAPRITVVQEAKFAESDHERDAEILAVRSVELLKANLAEAWLRPSPLRRPRRSSRRAQRRRMARCPGRRATSRGGEAWASGSERASCKGWARPGRAGPPPFSRRTAGRAGGACRRTSTGWARP